MQGNPTGSSWNLTRIILWFTQEQTSDDDLPHRVQLSHAQNLIRSPSSHSEDREDAASRTQPGGTNLSGGSFDH
jgi:hypothetical protein